MFEERDRTYKDGLIERIEPHVGKGERVQAVAVTQVGAPPWVQALPLAVGLVLIVVSTLAGALPGWLGIVGAVLVLVGLVAMSFVPRRLVARTNRGVLVFGLPRSQRAAIEEPRARIPLDELPAATSGPVELAGERLWANFGSSIERHALVEVLAPK